MPDKRLRLQWKEGGLDHVKVCVPETSTLTQAVATANERGVELARKRLTCRLPSAALTSLNAYFAAPAVHRRGDNQPVASDWTTQRMLQDLCGRAQSVVSGVKAKGIQIGILSRSGAIDLDRLGQRVEPDSDLYVLDPNAVQQAAASNASVEVRVFDRQCTDWAQVSDDIAAVSGADVFMKLFIAGGEASVNNWHRDTSDVLVTILDGSKQFQVATVESPDDLPKCEIDVVLRPGDALLLPRSRLHNATPTGEVSALLSVGLMRCADWSYRSVRPSHLGLTNPRSPTVYRLALRPHTPPTPGATAVDAPWRSRTPGGIAVLDHDGDKVVFVAAGRIWETEADVVILLALIHGADGATVAELSTMTGRTRDWCAETADELVTLGLVRRG